MSMEITGIVGHSVTPGVLPGGTRAPRMPTLAEQAARLPDRELPSGRSPEPPLESLVRDLEVVASALNRRLQFSINRELGEVIVKVIDRQTDKVIKELPPREIQRLHVRLREAIGLLIDEQI